MFALKMIAITALSAFLISGGGGSGCQTKKISAANIEKPTPEKPATGDLTVLAEGPNSAINNSFVAVVRDADTYDALTKLEERLPKRDADFFKTNIVVAAFLGQRPTGGYGVEITHNPGGELRLVESTPRGMVTQAITAPFKVVSFSVSGLPPVSLTVDKAFQERLQLYRVTTGKFKTIGGFAGRSEEFPLEGQLQLTREHDLITVAFALKGSGSSGERALIDTATGVMKDGRLVIQKLSHGSLVGIPSGALHATATFQETNGLLLELDTGPVEVPDGFSGKGTVTAVMVAASAN